MRGLDPVHVCAFQKLPGFHVFEQVGGGAFGGRQVPAGCNRTGAGGESFSDAGGVGGALEEGSLAHLSILYSPTCVGLRYGSLSIRYAFSRQKL